MKLLIKIFVLILLSFSNPNAQHLFPLHVGDKWLYRTYVNTYPVYSIVCDTLMSNGKHYFRMANNQSLPELYRQAGDSVFSFNTLLKKEYLIFNFNANVGDTISCLQFVPEMLTQVITLFSKGTNEILNVNRSSFTFWLQYPELTEGSYLITITDSLGITYYGGEGGEQNLAGAIINNIQYGNLVHVKIPTEIPSNFYLAQNYPNPFNPATTINYSLPKSSFVTIKIYDILGRDVTTLVNENKPIGNYSIQLNASKLVSGVYFYRMTAEDFVQTKKLILLK